jgi:hypothetical protein
MGYGRVRCQVIETQAAADRAPRGQDWPRDLLPWADPYIATLMVRLERQYDWVEAWISEDWTSEPESDHPLADDEAEFSAAFFGAACGGAAQDADAFLPGWQEGFRRPHFPPVYGGFPLLDDVTDGLEEDPV